MQCRWLYTTKILLHLGLYLKGFLGAYSCADWEIKGVDGREFLNLHCLVSL